MENKFYYIEYKNNGISGDAFVYTEAVDGLDEDAIVAVDNESVEELKALHEYELDANCAMASQYIEKLETEVKINSQAFENLNRKLAEANERIVEFESIKEGHKVYIKDLFQQIFDLRNKNVIAESFINSSEIENYMEELNRQGLNK